MRRRTRLRPAAAVSRIRSRRMECIRTSTRSWRSRVPTRQSSARTVAWCARAERLRTSHPSVPTAASPARIWRTCQQLLSAVPTFLYNLNKGLSTLQFQSLSVAADNPKHLQGGTQDNGTFETTGSAVVWPQIMYGDGGQSGFNVGNSGLRFNSFTSNFHDVNFQNGDPVKWVNRQWSNRGQPRARTFYAPIIADPVSAGTIFEGSLSVWRTQDWAGNQAFLEANCPEFTTSGANPACGDFVRIGPTGATDLTAADADYRGTTRCTGGNCCGGCAGSVRHRNNVGGDDNRPRVHLEKCRHDATRSSRTRDSTRSHANSSGRFVSGITIDPADPNHAWIVVLELQLPEPRRRPDTSSK